ncbi:hypothetical protein L9F63_007551 [Diploptera punctata]|uniref:Uncharacterized protein n=1 Tax=Diploptera punctata TaxID=6984 RepID=A0AAD7Z8F2_DIPPU|nr:hypothetical protein L9F63_007551 [Diploptera punctata]
MHTPVGTMECVPQTQDGDGSTALTTSRDDQDNFNNSILCIKEELGQLSLQVTSPKEEPPPPAEAQDADSNDNSSKESASSPGVSVDYQDPSAAQRAGWIDGLLGCLRPVWTIIGKAAANEIKGKQDDWEIPFETISDLKWLGSGAQGAVFSGKLKGEVVAVKKVREQRETDIRNPQEVKPSQHCAIQRSMYTRTLLLYHHGILPIWSSVQLTQGWRGSSTSKTC